MNAEKHSVAVLAFVCLSACADPAIVADAPVECESCEKWNQPQEAFQVYGNTYFVGVEGLSSILIDSGDGLILLDGGLPQTAPLIVENIDSLGYSITDVKIIALSHAHFDHAGGIAALQRASGASVVARAPAAQALRAGDLLAGDPQYGAQGSQFPAVAAVDIISDNDVLQMGELSLQAFATPGHTKGGTSWSWESCEDDGCRTVVYADSLSAVSAGAFRFNTGPEGAADLLRKSAHRIAKLDCDILLTPHPIIDNGCSAYAAEALEGLNTRLRQEMLR